MQALYGLSVTADLLSWTNACSTIIHAASRATLPMSANDETVVKRVYVDIDSLWLSLIHI